MDKFSNSRIQCYKSCRRMYWLRYVEGLVPVESTAAQERGKSYHSKVEQIMSCGTFDRDENAKTNAMARAFLEFVFPRISATDVEEWVEFKTSSGSSVIGRLDGRNGQSYLIEHKTTSGDIDELYVAMLEMDEQIMTYMLATGIRDMKYTVCKTPTIRQKKDETDDEFEERCLNWYMEDPESRIRVIDIHRDDATLDEFAETLDRTIEEIQSCDLWYRNTRYCHIWGKPCEYASVCMTYQPGQECIGFTRKEME